MAEYVTEKKLEKEHKNCTDAKQMDMNSKVKEAVIKTLSKVKNESLYDRFDKKSTKKDNDVLDMQKTLETTQDMFKKAATHIEAHIPEVAEKHAEAIDKALHSNDYFIDHPK